MDIIAELRQRQAALQQLMEEKQLDTVVIAGNSSVGPICYGNLRYFSDHRVYYHLQAYVARPGMAPVFCCGSILHLESLHLKGFEDIRVSPDILGSVMKILAEKPFKRLGVVFDMLPVDWEERILQEYPGVELVDINNAIFDLRNEHSDYEVECIRQCAKIADAGYAAVCSMAKVGAKMRDVHAELDYAMKSAGAEECFTLMSNGKFSYVNNQMPCIRPFSMPDDRVIEYGDCIGMEITPKYKGYWTQMVRTVCNGETNPDMKRAHEIQLDVIGETVPLLKPGAKLGDVLKHMWKRGEELGFVCKLPFGHIVGQDLDEGGRGSLESDLIIQKNSNFVLHPTLVLGNEDFSIFWGDPYLVTENGGERLNFSSTELLTL